MTGEHKPAQQDSSAKTPSRAAVTPGKDQNSQPAFALMAKQHKIPGHVERHQINEPAAPAPPPRHLWADVWCSRAAPATLLGLKPAPWAGVEAGEGHTCLPFNFSLFEQWGFSQQSYSVAYFFCFYSSYCNISGFILVLNSAPAPCLPTPRPQAP